MNWDVLCLAALFLYLFYYNEVHSHKYYIVYVYNIVYIVKKAIT